MVELMLAASRNLSSGRTTTKEADVNVFRGDSLSKDIYTRRKQSGVSSKMSQQNSGCVLLNIRIERH